MNTTTFSSPYTLLILFHEIIFWENTVGSLHDICTNHILFFRSWANLYEFFNKLAVALQKMPVPSMPQNKTEPHQTTPYTQHSHPTLASIRSHGQMKSIAISWTTEDNLLLIASLGHDNNNKIHLDFHVEIQAISCLHNWNISTSFLFFSFYLLQEVNFVVKKWW